MISAKKRPPFAVKSPAYEELETALSDILVAIIDHRAAKEAAFVGPIKATPFKWLDDDQILTPKCIAVREILKDTVEGSLICALQFIGERLFKAGGTGLMRTALETVADRDRKRGGLMLSVADR